ncbi:dynamin family protein [Pectobacterium polonicum]|uniref:Dynamin family protein n=1 Tax=Pectobacterium polonicum TaxID=2485124 RepID=A0AAE9T084_9GAMM|nr:dynamin family protein [Pectobacterium polonicum]UVO07162.1 dynamin family protein [Pectobacterium polonicum]
MHENNIALLCDEADRLLQLNINLLKKMVDEPNVLLDNKQNRTEQLFDKNRAIKRIEELQGEQTKINRKEMVLAVVGTMKAGKSTTINAIVGKEILPNRNRPMTSIPTLIRHVPGKIEPELQLNNIEPIVELLIALQKKIATPEGKKTVLELQKDQDNCDLLNIPFNDTWLKTTYCGEAEIFTGLSSLNDLVRLASMLNVEFPFDAYEEVQELPVIEVEFSHLTGMDDSQGTLTLLDTPGPNEAGQPRMELMMRDQLQKASAVLAVMDYTQMNSKADDEVRKELNAIAEVSAGRLFILVNKFDEKDRNGDSAEVVKQKVPAMLKGDVLPSSRVYPGSSRQAYLANRALHELQYADSLSLTEAWVDDFVKEAFGRIKKENIYQNKEMIIDGATGLWGDSLIDQLITEVIQTAHAKAAALAVDSAAAKLVQNAENTNEYLSLRHRGLLTSIQSLQTQISNLLSDIQNIGHCQKEVKSDVDNAMRKIREKTNELLDDAKQTLQEELNSYFESGKRKERETLEAQNPPSSVRTGFLSNIVSSFTASSQYRDRDFDPRDPEIKFSERRDAIKMIEQIETSVTNLLTDTEKQIKPTLEKIVKGIEESFQSSTLKAVEKIAGQINERLEDDGFTVNISFPKVSHLQTQLAIKTNLNSLLEEKTDRVNRRRRSSGAWGTVCGWLNTDDWGWEDYSVEVSRSVVNINAIRREVFLQTDTHFGELTDTIETNINQPILQEIELFFGTFKSKVEQLRNTLIQSTEDHKNNQQEQQRLTERLKELNEITPEILRDSKALKEELEPML